MERQLTLYDYLDNNRPHFSGADCNRMEDRERLTGQIKRIYDLMKDRQWRTLTQIAEHTCDPEASISAQLRNLRKARFGGYVVERQNCGGGLFQYRLIV
jgi:hypothetical protein